MMPMAGSRLPVTLVRGEGCRVWDDEGREYLDFVGGWAVNSLGHCPPVTVNALREQAATLIHVSNQFYTVPQVKLARLLVENSCLDKVFFSNSGAEANEGAVKLARKYGKLHRHGAYEVITALNSFHGRTLAMVAATGQPKYQAPFTPMPEGFLHVPYNDLEALKRATSEKTCAVMLEPLQGEGGVNMPDPDYFPAGRRWCDEQGLLLILDEIQTGLGRTGTLWGYQQLGIEPDVITLAKGLASGVAIGAFLAKERCAVLAPGDHAHTFGGNPLACAAAYATVSYILENDIPGHARRVGEHFLGRLSALQSAYPALVAGCRGWGLLL
ncbi:MAG: aspartate aminotransferase family protein, partial [Chloroflexota bacterium]